MIAAPLFGFKRWAYTLAPTASDVLFSMKSLNVPDSVSFLYTRRIGMIASAWDIGDPPCNDWSDAQALHTPCCLLPSHISIA